MGPTTKEHLGNLENMKVSTNDWFVITYPKSGEYLLILDVKLNFLFSIQYSEFTNTPSIIHLIGTTWTQEMMYLMKTKGNTSKAETVPVYIRVPFLDIASDADDTSAETKGEQVFIKSHFPHHMMPKNVMKQKPKIVVVHRNPKDVAVSFYNMYQSCSLLVG